MNSVIKDTIVVLLPAYNEADIILWVLKNLKDFSKILVIDDCSQDETRKLAIQAGVHVVTLDHHSGKGEAIKLGFQYTLKNFDFEAIIIMDADGQHLPEDINKFLELWENRKPDMIIGVRNLKVKNISPTKRLWNRFIGFFIFVISGRRFLDSQSGFRLLSRSVVEKMRLTQPGYSVETEMIFEVMRNHLSIGEVPIETVQSNKNFSLWSNIRRACSILLYTIYEWQKMVMKKTRALLKSLKPIWHLVSLVIFLIFLVITFYQSLGHIDKSKIASFNSFGLELKTALEWLKNNSDPDAIVMAHWFRGHQIVAFADRRVISTTKVYPTESPEVANRYRDIGKFFLTSSEEEAKSIADKYGASYVFVVKDFDAWICKANNQCGLVHNRKLVPLAKQKTMAGLMTQGADFSNFKKVWDSPRFVIYQVTNNDARLSMEVKRAAIIIVRKTLEALLWQNKKLTADDFKIFIESRGLTKEFSQPLDVDTTLWNNQQLRASQLSFDGSLVENLVTGAIKTITDWRFLPVQKEELTTTRIEITVFKKDFSPLDLYSIHTEKINPSYGYALDYLGRKTYYAPVIFNIKRFENLIHFLNELCDKASLDNNCYLNPDVTIYTFNVEDFIESRDKKTVLSLSGPLIIDIINFSKLQLRSRLTLAADWLIKNQDRNGLYPSISDTLTGAQSQNLGWGRNPLAAQSLVSFYRLTGDKRYLFSALRNLQYLDTYNDYLKKHSPDKPIPNAYIIFRLFADLELFKATHNNKYLTNAEKLTAILWSLKNEDGSFQKYVYADGRSYSADDQTSTIGDYQALTALTAFANASGDKNRLEDLKFLAKQRQDKFRIKRILENEPMPLGKLAWLVNGFKELYQLTKEKEYADFAFEVADWLIDFQHPGNEYQKGSFVNTSPLSPTRGTSKVTEAIADAYVLAKELDDSYKAMRYKQSLENALMWLMHMQLTRENSFWVNGFIVDKSVGGFRHDLLNPELWNDSATHTLLAATNYLLHYGE